MCDPITINTKRAISRLAFLKLNMTANDMHLSLLTAFDCLNCQTYDTFCAWINPCAAMTFSSLAGGAYIAFLAMCAATDSDTNLRFTNLPGLKSPQPSVQGMGQGSSLRVRTR